MGSSSNMSSRLLRQLYRVGRGLYQAVIPHDLRRKVWALRQDSSGVANTNLTTGVQAPLPFDPVGAQAISGASQAAAKLTTPPTQDVATHIAEILAPMVRNREHIQHFDFWQEHGFHVTQNHFYEPVPDTRDLKPEFWTTPSLLNGIDMNDEEQLHLLRDVFPQFMDEYNDIPFEETDDPTKYFTNNIMFGGTDSLVYYCLVRHFKPDTILEVGSGFSTLIAAEAAVKNGGSAVTCIEPYPRDFLKKGFPGLKSLIPEKVQDVDRSVFANLKPGDFLFIDTSHVVKMGSEVLYLYFEILPSIPEGVIVHIHDIFFPLEYPKSFVLTDRHFWNEQYLVQAFLMYNDSFKVLYGNSYMSHYHMQDVKNTFPNANRWHGGSLWLRRSR
ncbi:MAG: class I SAM-dependent methyltransferase [Anaerolineaceae bacterium]|nr:class I SAM-dependent methyltransferase [Anaerolineaceae bacterium]